MAPKIAAWLLPIIQVLTERGVAARSQIVGCTSAEIEEIADGRELPSRYRDFLKAMGRGAGRFYEGSDVFYPQAVGLTKGARNLVAQDPAKIALSDDAIAIVMHQGYQFLFVRGSEGDDPPVYYYLEQSGEFEKKDDSFCGFLSSVIHDEW